MKLILVSDPGKIEGEHELVNEVLELGLDYFHLRKPDYTKKEIEAFLRRINPKYIKKVMLHSHHMLVGKYNIGGFHFPKSFLQNEDHIKLLELIKNARKRRLRIGTSVHSLQDAANLKGFNYYFLSPVFDSISKEGYKTKFDYEVLREFINDISSNKDQPEAIALGGIDENNIAKIKDFGFSGVALLGAIWKDFKVENFNYSVEKFREIQRQLNYE